VFSAQFAHSKDRYVSGSNMIRSWFLFCQSSDNI